MNVREWGVDFLEDILAQAGAREDGEFQENVFTEEAIRYLVGAGECIDPELAYHRGRGVKLNAWDLHQENDSVDLFVSLFDSTEPCRKVPRSEASDALARCRRFLEKSMEGLWKELEESSEAFTAAQTLHALSASLKRAKVYLLTNGVVDPEPFPDVAVRSVDVSHFVCDLDKLFQCTGNGAIREPISIGPDDLGGGLSCVKLPGENPAYESYVGVVPGTVLAAIYQRWGQRILERNVRSYLQARGAVNKKILETLQKEPQMFLAYNNGISTVAESVETEALGGSVVAVRRLRNFQVVNGAQTTASLHDAQKNRGADLSGVYVQFKLTVLKDPTRVDELVPFISRYANTQTKVNLSDFSANDPYHIQLERLSRVTWVPSEKGKSTTKWFYERARGGYINAMNAEGTVAKKRAFKATYPKSQMLNKTSVAKYQMSWARLPHFVSLGAEKNFSRFMDRISREPRQLPDERYFKRLVAKAILFRECDRIVGQQEFGGYKANIVTYTVAWLSYLTGQRIDLERVWEDQRPSEEVRAAMVELSKAVWEHLNHPPPYAKNLSEWAKREACWTTLRDKPHPLPNLEGELVSVVPSEGPDLERVPETTPVSPQAEADIALVESPGPDWWFALAHWAAETDNLQGWERRLAFSIGRLLASHRHPSPKQAHQGARILGEASDAGFKTPANVTNGTDGPTEPEGLVEAQNGGRERGGPSAPVVGGHDQS
jgi:hypothetical protein